MKLNDYVKSKDNPNSLVWRIIELCYDYYVLQWKGNGSSVSMRVTGDELNSNYIKVNIYGEEIEEDPQFNLFEDFQLVSGNQPKLDQDLCYHEYILYTGLRESYEFCVKCDKKRPIK